MLYTGLVGNLSNPLLEVLLMHPGFKVTGCFYPDNNEKPQHKSTSGKKIPLLSKEELIDKNDVLIFRKTYPGVMNLLAMALKKSRHILLMDVCGLSAKAIAYLIKLRDEVQTVVYTKNIERSNPALQACLPLIIHPSFLEIKLMIPDQQVHGNTESVNRTLLRMIDALLFLIPLNIKKIQAFRQPRNASNTCFINARIDFDNGSAANLLAANITEKESFIIDIYQKRNLFRIDMLDQKLLSLEKQEKSVTVNSRAVNPKKGNGQLFNNELETLYNSIMSKSTSNKDLFEIFRIAELSMKINEKAGFNNG
ncbi:MAG: hypothetical protein R6U58_02260 [Bacteroidales bacterium]